MKLKTKLYLTLLALALIAGMLIGCVPDAQPGPREEQTIEARVAQVAPAETLTHQPAPATPVVPATPPHTAAHEVQPCSQPLRIAFLVDLSSSTRQFAVSLPDRADLERLVHVVRTCGGEVAFAPIQEDPRNRTPFVRLRIEPPDATSREPQRTDYPDVFQFAKARRQWKKNAAQYKERARDREARNAVAIRDFLDRAEIVLARGATAPATDIFGALRRGNVFHGEDPASWAVAPRKFTLMVTDGYHTVIASHYEPMPSDVTVLVAHGSSDMGSLAKLDPAPMGFESVGAAIRYLEAQGGK